jgi:anionic cell wall polymer biosynthesis LytR-Cps2A-Psr (LCP) family protein
LLARTLQENFGIQIDHYLAVNLSAFRKIVDTMGGLDVYFSQPVYIKKFEKPKLYLKAGQHHLSGKEAENVVRTRIEIGDFGRIRNQTVVLKAVTARLITPSGIQNIPPIIQQMKSSVLTDLSPAEISQMICLAERIDPERDISFDQIPTDKLREDRVYDSFLDYNPYVLLYNDQEIRQLVIDFLNGSN